MGLRQDIKNYSDLELIAFYKAEGDNIIVGELYERYVHLVFGVCMKYFKEEERSRDAVMVIFEDLMVKLKKHEVENFKGWLHRVASNHCLMQLRSKKNVLDKSAEIKNYHGAVVELETPLHPNGAHERERKIENLEHAMEHLNDEQKTCVTLFYLENKSYEEVAAQTGFNLKAVKSYIQNGKRNLKIILEKKHVES
ncbi:MAG: sigma-70 family RNA polymerase sigma factor [Sphingobacteriales bacterium]|nr:MAG: sigma-70 family RNA polymerase sigma factor [Sphingobacteriales bacterium]